LLIRVQADLFIEMPYERALAFIAKRLDFLTEIANEYLKEIAQIKGHMTMTYAVMDPANLQ
jgi:prefoldin subunit 5